MAAVRNMVNSRKVEGLRGGMEWIRLEKGKEKLETCDTARSISNNQSLNKI